MRELRAIIAVLVAIALLAGGVALYNQWQTIKQLKSDVEQADRTGKATGGIAGDAGTTQEVIHRTEVVVRDGRESYMRGYEDAKRDPVVADWADTPVPPQLRDLARARRIERSGGVDDGSRDPAATP